ncbi:Signal transduction histidine kinase [Virgibacillus subterraneus]|uniref:histidine kinase n=2 Tax=Virgibacillus TaxID=84406 RepID=A0A1H1FWK4_9BACI|nr:MULTISPECIES: HAMP domain-containing sensor histidine kinase [Virgibacillus]SDR05373.1 Signal transduction histidine kinase [Virgibacillus salinus]SEQ76413.1 Signal transduction histidine kinase [Virgibacillus subterraneus]
MKLQSQLNLAFTTLLLVMLTVTGLVIYSLLMDMLIEDEQAELKQNGELLVQVLNENGRGNSLQGFSDFLDEQDLDLFLYNRHQNRVLDSTMPPRYVNGFSANNNFADDQKEIWEIGNNKFVTSRILFNPESTGLELILLTPINDLQAVQQDFFQRLMIVFIIGAIAAVFLSYFLTNKLVTPLSRLKGQLKKIENRKFDELESIKATGEIKEVEQSVYEMASELQRYVNSQQAFFQNASHELKTPLMTIQGYAEGIRDKVFDEQEQEKGLDMMVTEVKRLKMIINEMILLAKLDSEQTAYQPENVSTSTLINQVMDRTLPMVNEKNITINQEVDEGSSLFVDQEKVLRALLNITFNAIRHAKTRVDITVEKSTIVIEDDGEGISKDLLPHIFHRFVKGNNGETGLGLAIARAIIEQSGGKIMVHESKLGGAKFILSFTN